MRDYRQILIEALACERSPARMLVIRTIVVAMATIIVAAPSQAAVPPGCPSLCGNASISYPFGIGAGCYSNSQFKITCNSTYNPPQALLRGGNIEIIDISPEGELRVYTYIGSSCMRYDTNTGTWNPSSDLSSTTTLSAFSFSTTRNRFTAVGCDTLATIAISNDDNSSSGCLSLCNSKTSFSEGQCDGFGCCQTALPQNLLKYTIRVKTYNNDTDVWNFSPCSYVFIGETASFNFSSDDLSNIRTTTVPTVIDWAQQNLTAYACKADNSLCYMPKGINGYRCNCSIGYQGNAYLSGGCTDINECQQDNDCTNICENTPGSYKCSCPKGYVGDGKQSGTRCVRKSDHLLVIKITVGVSVGITALLLIVGFLYLGMKKRNLIKMKEKYFQQNGGFLLQQQLGGHDQSARSNARIFTAEELNKATNNFSEMRIVGRGGYGTVYKGFLPNNTIVAIKKSKQVDQTQIEQFVNEVIVLSQINHRNVVRLLGCCLETEVPLLVYEFISNGTLFDHIHGRDMDSNMSWETRLRIAAETAGVLSYLHSAASVPIIHRDIKSANILLDENYVAKVSDFGASRLVPLDQTEMSTMVQGTLGYLDPEYLHTSTLTDKSDVYSFGVVLVELLTGKKALSFDKPEEERCLAKYFLSSLKEDRLFQIIECSTPSDDREAQQVKEAALLAMRCLRIKGEERPTMKEVAMELEGIRVIANHPWVAIDLNPEESENLLGGTTDSLNYTDSSVVYDSMRNQVLLPLAGGR